MPGGAGVATGPNRTLVIRPVAALQLPRTGRSSKFSHWGVTDGSNAGHSEPSLQLLQSQPWRTLFDC
jgi:hypothetical protein